MPQGLLTAPRFGELLPGWDTKIEQAREDCKYQADVNFLAFCKVIDCSKLSFRFCFSLLAEKGHCRTSVLSF